MTNLKFWRRSDDSPEIDLNQLYVTIKIDSEKLNESSDKLRIAFNEINMYLEEFFALSGIEFTDPEPLYEYKGTLGEKYTVYLSIHRKNTLQICFFEDCEWEEEIFYYGIEQASRVKLSSGIQRLPSFLVLYSEKLRSQKKKYEDAVLKAEKILQCLQ